MLLLKVFWRVPFPLSVLFGLVWCYLVLKFFAFGPVGGVQNLKPSVDHPNLTEVIGNRHTGSGLLLVSEFFQVLGRVFLEVLEARFAAQLQFLAFVGEDVGFAVSTKLFVADDARLQRIGLCFGAFGFVSAKQGQSTESEERCERQLFSHGVIVGHRPLFAN